MPIDPNIALGYKGINIPDPLNQLAQVSQIQNAQNQNSLAQYQIEKARRGDEITSTMDQLMAKHVNPLTGEVNKTALFQDLAAAKMGSQIMPLQKGFAEQEKAQVELNKTAAEAAIKQTELFRGQLTNVRNPQQAAQWVQAQYADPVLGKVVRQVPIEEALADIPKDPKQFDNWKNQNALGMAEWVKRNTMTAAEKATDQRARDRNQQESTSVVYQQDANGNYVALPSKLKAGEVPKARTVVAPGAGMTPLEGKPSEAVAKERGSINQQKSIIANAIKEVQANPDAFGAGRGVLGTMAGESAAGKMYETPEETQARAFLFNTVSNVIHERAGTAQSAGERDTLMRFLPSEFDNDKQIVDKLKGYEKFLSAKESGTGHRKSETPSATGNSVSLPDGRTMNFPNAAAAAAFKKAAGL